MTTSFRSWWRNCALQADSEIIAIDRMEDQIAPLGANVSRIRQLVSNSGDSLLKEPLQNAGVPAAQRCAAIF